MAEIQVIADSWVEIALIGLIAVSVVAVFKLIPSKHRITITKEKPKDDLG